MLFDKNLGGVEPGLDINFKTRLNTLHPQRSPSQSNLLPFFFFFLSSLSIHINCGNRGLHMYEVDSFPPPSPLGQVLDLVEPGDHGAAAPGQQE